MLSSNNRPHPAPKTLNGNGNPAPIGNGSPNHHIEDKLQARTLGETILDNAIKRIFDLIPDESKRQQYSKTSAYSKKLKENATRGLLVPITVELGDSFELDDKTLGIKIGDSPKINFAHATAKQQQEYAIHCLYLSYEALILIKKEKLVTGSFPGPFTLNRIKNLFTTIDASWVPQIVNDLTEALGLAMRDFFEFSLENDLMPRLKDTFTLMLDVLNHRFYPGHVGPMDENTNTDESRQMWKESLKLEQQALQLHDELEPLSRESNENIAFGKLTFKEFNHCRKRIDDLLKQLHVLESRFTSSSIVKYNLDNDTNLYNASYLRAIHSTGMIKALQKDFNNEKAIAVVYANEAIRLSVKVKHAHNQNPKPVNDLHQYSEACDALLKDLEVIRKRFFMEDGRGKFNLQELSNPYNKSYSKLLHAIDIMNETVASFQNQEQKSHDHDKEKGQRKDSDEEDEFSTASDHASMLLEPSRSFAQTNTHEEMDDGLGDLDYENIPEFGMDLSHGHVADAGTSEVTEGEVDDELDSLDINQIRELERKLQLETTANAGQKSEETLPVDEMAEDEKAGVRFSAAEFSHLPVKIKPSLTLEEIVIEFLSEDWANLITENQLTEEKKNKFYNILAEFNHFTHGIAVHYIEETNEKRHPGIIQPLLVEILPSSIKALKLMLMYLEALDNADIGQCRNMEAFIYFYDAIETKIKILNDEFKTEDFYQDKEKFARISASYNQRRNEQILLQYRLSCGRAVITIRGDEAGAQLNEESNKADEATPSQLDARYKMYQGSLEAIRSDFLINKTILLESKVLSDEGKEAKLKVLREEKIALLKQAYKKVKEEKAEKQLKRKIEDICRKKIFTHLQAGVRPGSTFEEMMVSILSEDWKSLVAKKPLSAKHLAQFNDFLRELDAFVHGFESHYSMMTQKACSQDLNIQLLILLLPNDVKALDLLAEDLKVLFEANISQCSLLDSFVCLRNAVNAKITKLSHKSIHESKVEALGEHKEIDSKMAASYKKHVKEHILSQFNNSCRVQMIKIIEAGEGNPASLESKNTDDIQQTFFRSTIECLLSKQMPQEEINELIEIIKKKSATSAEEFLASQTMTPGERTARINSIKEEWKKFEEDKSDEHLQRKLMEACHHRISRSTASKKRYNATLMHLDDIILGFVSMDWQSKLQTLINALVNYVEGLIADATVRSGEALTGQEHIELIIISLPNNLLALSTLMTRLDRLLSSYHGDAAEKAALSMLKAAVMLKLESPWEYSFTGMFFQYVREFKKQFSLRMAEEAKQAKELDHDKSVLFKYQKHLRDEMVSTLKREGIYIPYQEWFAGLTDQDKQKVNGMNDADKQQTYEQWKDEQVKIFRSKPSSSAIAFKELHLKYYLVHDMYQGLMDSSLSPQTRLQKLQETFDKEITYTLPVISAAQQVLPNAGLQDQRSTIKDFLSKKREFSLFKSEGKKVVNALYHPPANRK